jgi:hypothetical protein
MTVANLVLPSKGWGSYKDALRAVGEKRFDGDFRDLSFLTNLGLVEFQGTRPTLTTSGRAYFEAQFIRDDQAGAQLIVQEALRNYPPASVILQMLRGVPTASREKAVTVLRSFELNEGLSDRSLGSLLSMLNTAGLVSYNKKSGSFRVLQVEETEAMAPQTEFISPSSPYGNKFRLRRILRECDHHLWWLDKHFMPAAFDSLWEAADGARLADIRILSLLLDGNSSRNAWDRYGDLRKELSARSIDLEWRFVDSRDIRDAHDRWVIGEGQAWNVPNVNAIVSGQYAELHRTPNVAELKALFNAYWGKATPVDRSLFR